MTTVEELYKITEKELDNNRQKVVELLIQALNDWRSSVNSVENYAEKLKSKFELKVISKDTIEGELNALNPATHSWEIESLTNLTEAFTLSETDNFHSLLDYIKKDN